jgi:hypothetical protein
MQNSFLVNAAVLGLIWVLVGPAGLMVSVVFAGIISAFLYCHFQLRRRHKA